MSFRRFPSSERWFYVTQAKSRPRTLRFTWRKCKWQKRNITAKRVFTHYCSESDGLRQTSHFSKLYLNRSITLHVLVVLNFLCTVYYYLKCSNNRKKGGPCGCLDGQVKELNVMFMARELDRRSKFFCSPSHLCAVNFIYRWMWR